MILFYAEIDVHKHVVKKNNRDIFKNKRTGRVFPGKSNELRNMEAQLFFEIKRKWHGGAPIKKYINAKFTFVFTEEKFYTKKSVINKALPDMSNLYQIVEDCLQKAGVIYNDHFIASHDGSRRCSGNETKLIIELQDCDESL